MTIRRRLVRKVPARTGVAIRAQRKKRGNWLADPKRVMTAVLVMSLAVFFLVLAMGAVNHWTADNTLLTTAGNGKATIIGNVQYVSGRSGQESDKAWSLDGKGSVVAIPDSSTLYNARTMTMSGWFKLDPAGHNSWHTVYSKRDGGRFEHILYVNKGSGVLRARLGTAISSIWVDTRARVVKPGQWVHYAVVANTSTGRLQIWINGTNVVTKSFATTSRVRVGWTWQNRRTRVAYRQRYRLGTWRHVHRLRSWFGVRNFNHYHVRYRYGTAYRWQTRRVRVARYANRTAIINNTRSPWVLGAGGTPTTGISRTYERFVGVIDDFRIDTTALGATTIKALSTVPAPTATPEPTPTPTPVPSADPTATPTPPTATPVTSGGVPTTTKGIDDLLKEMGKRLQDAD